ncbi:hypothetical protein FSP39_000989, partial [Pinctada imbricata]
AQNLQICDMDEDLVKKLKNFRFRKEKDVAYMILKVDKNSMKIELDEDDEEEEMDDKIEEIQQRLPENQPRFVVISYVFKHTDGRISYPLCLVNYSPRGSHEKHIMMHSGSVKYVQNTSGITKLYEIRDKDDFTEEWLLEKLKMFS